MHKLLTLLAVSTFIVACTNTNPSKDQQPGTKSELSKSTGPDGADLLKTLEGRWENQDDASLTLEFADTKLRRFKQGVLSAESDIQVDANCETTVCRIDSTELIDGWCFMEKGPTGTQCYIVVDCNKEFLKYSPVATPKLVQVFKKL